MYIINITGYEHIHMHGGDKNIFVRFDQPSLNFQAYVCAFFTHM